MSKVVFFFVRSASQSRLRNPMALTATCSTIPNCTGVVCAMCSRRRPKSTCCTCTHTSTGRWRRSATWLTRLGTGCHLSPRCRPTRARPNGVFPLKVPVFSACLVVTWNLVEAFFEVFCFIVNMSMMLHQVSIANSLNFKLSLILFLFSMSTYVQISHNLLLLLNKV